MKAVVWEDEGLGAKYHDEEIPADLNDQAEEYREKLVEAAVELDDDAMTAYLDGNEPGRGDAEAADPQGGAVTGAFYPGAVRLGLQEQGRAAAARRGRRLSAVAGRSCRAIKGIDSTRATRSCASRPTTSRCRCSPSRSWTTRSSARSPSAASIPASSRAAPTVLNSTKDKKERIGRMLLMHANNREDIKEAYAGDIVALAGLKDTRTGDTLCDPQKPVILEKMEFPEPVIEIAIEPKSKADQEKLGVALAKLAAEDPSFRVSTDQESGQTIIKGMGELHLDIKVDILRRTYKVDANIGAPQVAYREKLTKRVEIELHPQEADRRHGPVRASVKIVFEPAEPGAGSCFEIEDRRRRGAEGIHSGRRKGHQQRHGVGRARRLPGRRCQGDPDRRRLITKSTSSVLAFEIASRARLPRSSAEGRLGAARADHEGRSDDAGRLHRFGDGRSARPSRPGAGPGHARQRRRHQCDGAARQHVRLCQSAAVLQPGPRQLTRCSSITTSRCRRAKPPRFRRNSPRRSVEKG